MNYIELSNKSANIIENLACHIAERNNHRITAAHLIPHLPLPLAALKKYLDDMLDGVAVYSEVDDGKTWYVFSNPDETGDSAKSADRPKACICCSSEIPPSSRGIICSDCRNVMLTELRRTATVSNWPSQALFEHEMLYVSSEHNNPVHPSTLAGHSRYTLKQVQEKMEELCLEGFVSQTFNDEKGSILYDFPDITYPLKNYEDNLAILESFPSTIQEAVEARVTKIFFALGVLVLCLFALAFMRVPFPFLIIAFLAAAPVISYVIWKRPGRPPQK